MFTQSNEYVEGVNLVHGRAGAADFYSVSGMVLEIISWSVLYCFNFSRYRGLCIRGFKFYKLFNVMKVK